MLAGLAALPWLAIDGLADRSSNWRMFKAMDGLHTSHCVAVTVSPRGNVWVKHADAEEISVFDGYRIQTLPSPGRNSFRVYESRAGQLWSLYSAGLAVYAGNQWVQHPVIEIRAEIQADPLRQIRQIPLLPAERDRVLFLLSDKLMEYDSTSKRTLVLKHVSDTGLVRFLEMAEAQDGGIWITGARGIVKLSGPTRHLRPGAPHQEFLLADTLHAENLHRPFEDATGAVTVAATDSRSTGRRLVLRLEGGLWSVRAVEAATIRQAWPGWDQTTWAFTLDSLLRFDPPPPAVFSREKLWAGQYKDIATETNGVFWLATSEGLLRYAPYIWRTPVALEDITSHVHGMVEDQADRAWFASSEFLIRVQGNEPPRLIKWPEGVEGSVDPRDKLFCLTDGRLVIASGDRTFLFDPATEVFERLSHPSGSRIRPLGQFVDGVLVVQVITAQDREEPGFELERYDGESFQALALAPPDWTFGSELSFATPLSNGDLWVGGIGGVARLRHGQFEVFGPAQGFLESNPSCLADLGGGRLWCGGSTRLLEFNGKTWSVLRSGFDRINAITSGPQDRVWVATAHGLFSYARDSWMEHSVEEGLPSPGISDILTDRRGQLWVSTTRGVSRYHPDADLSPPKTLPPLLEDTKGRVTGESVTVLLNAVDKWQHTPGDRLMFSTRLNGGPWSPYTSSMVRELEQLGAGKHRLEVRAMDRAWNEDSDFVGLDFSVMLAWHRDPRFIGSVLSGAVLVVFFASLAINRHLRLIRSYAQVERIVALRTHELEKANEELLQSQKMKALGTLAAGIAHDFNNILSIIRGSAQIIQSNLEDRQKILTRLDRIQAVVEQGSGIVKTIFGLSRVKEMDLTEVDLNQIVESAIKLLGDRFLQGVALRFEPMPPLPPIVAVRELIQQMLINLILNAADAVDHRGDILLSTGRIRHLASDLALSPAMAGSYVYVAVHDDGCGIAPDVLPRIFEPFFTTKALSARRGTGLGLSMVYGVARQMGYGLEVQSQQGTGTTFRLIFPVGETVEPSSRLR